MKKRLKIVLFIGILLTLAHETYAKEVPFTLEDRDRLIRLEVTIKEFKELVDKRFEDLRGDTNKRFEQIDKRFEQIDKRFEQIDKRFEQIDKRFEQIDKRFEQIEKRIERLENIMMWGFGLLFTSMVGMVGFVLWDRRTAVAPLARVLKEREGEIEELKKREVEIEKREKVIEDIMRDYAQKEPRFAESIKAKGL